MRKALVLSITTHPARAATGANFSLMLPPAEKRPICTPWKGIFGQQLHREGLSPKGKLFAHRSFRCEKGQLSDRKVTLFENLDHLIAHGSRGTHNCNMVSFHIHSSLTLFSDSDPR